MGRTPAFTHSKKGEQDRSPFVVEKRNCRQRPNTATMAEGW
jgi:hypothetical protein